VRHGSRCCADPSTSCIIRKSDRCLASGVTGTTTL
jgi:hypothetical protein